MALTIETLKSTPNDTALVALITALSYSMSYAVDMGKCQYYDIPPWMVSVDISDILKNIILVLSGWWFVALGIDGFKRTRKLSNWIFIDLLALYGFLSAQLFLPWPSADFLTQYLRC